VEAILRRRWKRLNELREKVWLPSVLNHTPREGSTCIARDPISGVWNVAAHYDCTRSARSVLADVCRSRVAAVYIRKLHTSVVGRTMDRTGLALLASPEFDYTQPQIPYLSGEIGTLSATKPESRRICSSTWLVI